MNQDITFCAFRYALGRQTYVVGEVARYIIIHKHEFSKKYVDLMKKEIQEAISKGHAGHEIDVAEWRNVYEQLSLITP